MLTLFSETRKKIIKQAHVLITMFEEHIIKLLASAQIQSPKLEIPEPQFGDFAFPCFTLAKEWKKAPVLIAQELAKKLQPTDWVERIEVKGAYLNFFLNKTKVAECVLEMIVKQKSKFGTSTRGKGKKVVVEFSSPNIAKPFGVGHLRSTVIGNSIARMHDFLGYSVIRINHLGDWGTQFGKLITAFLKWGSATELKKEPIQHLLGLYVRFHEEAETHPELDEEARAWFKRLEDGDKKARTLWKQFSKLSLKEFSRIYKLLNVKFDSLNGESFYETMMPDVLQQAKEKGIAQEDKGALIVPLDNIIPLMLLKSDHASTYATRDLAAAIYRLKTYTPDKIAYVVGGEQSLHFQQVFATLQKLGYPAEKCTHVGFGLIRFPEGKMSTRKGNVIFLEDVLTKAIDLATTLIEQKSPGLKNKKKVAAQIGIGAVIFGDLINDRTGEVMFDWDKILEFDGDTGPYVQYTHARCCSIIRKAEKNSADKKKKKLDYHILEEAPAQAVIRLLAAFPEEVDHAARECKPHILAQHIIRVCRAFNDFYQKSQVLVDEPDIRAARIMLVDSVRQVIETGLYLLGIEAPEEM